MWKQHRKPFNYLFKWADFFGNLDTLVDKFQRRQAVNANYQRLIQKS